MRILTSPNPSIVLSISYSLIVLGPVRILLFTNSLSYYFVLAVSPANRGPLVLPRFFPQQLKPASALELIGLNSEWSLREYIFVLEQRFPDNIEHWFRFHSRGLQLSKSFTEGSDTFDRQFVSYYPQIFYQVNFSF